MTTVLHLNTPHGRRTIHPDAGADPRGLANLLALHGLDLNIRCRQRGLCKGCTVHLERGRLMDDAEGRIVAAPAEILACHARWLPGTEAAVAIPGRSLLAHKPSVADDFKIGVSVGKDPLFPGEFGIAVDIGTTTAVVLLAELATGQILARASDFNQQIRCGDDVLARIEWCRSDPGAVAQLQRAVCRETLAPLIHAVCREAGVGPERLGGMAVAANSTMLHLFLGVDPSPMGVAPFVPQFLEHRIGSAAAVGLCELPDLPIHTLPGLAAYVGADIAAGVFATGLHYEPGPVLFVDVGTNGEIVLVKDGRLRACATAAGPAFEGCGLRCGMRAAQGAIEAVSIARDAEGRISLSLKTIGDLPAARSPGICGSAYVDFLAQARRAGILMENGRFDPAAAEANPAFFPNARSEFQLCGGESPVCVTEADIACLLQSKAAVAAGIQTLLAREGLEAADLRKVYLAGGFGMHLDIAHSIACGLLPGFAPAQVEAVGNTSLGGAYLAMLDRAVIRELEQLRSQAEIIELNLDPGFEDRFIDNLALAAEPCSEMERK